MYTTGPQCIRCTRTKRVLKDKGVPFIEVDIRENPAAREYVVEDLGCTEAPVVVVSDEDHWSGFRPDQIGLASDPETQQAGRVSITKFTVLENTAEYRGTERVEGLKPLAHAVEAKFELGAGAAASLRKGDAVIVIGHERDASFEGENGIVYRRIIDASHIGPDLGNATAVAFPQPSRQLNTQKKGRTELAPSSHARTGEMSGAPDRIPLWEGTRATAPMSAMTR
ncbi:hypothetical protein HLA99_06895 [Microbacterium ulmi]|uniref:Glutaredoxin domain-containing protein n=1 Tax=Microbacterium ulmi TaxID=179095 RepID=A0A7Y2PZR6_9MICO|nr:hypothetical protein [Microbacterium ulmi]